jgi:hypothetical protein
MSYRLASLVENSCLAEMARGTSMHKRIAATDARRSEQNSKFMAGTPAIADIGKPM